MIFYFFFPSHCIDPPLQINDLDVTKGGIGASCDGENNVFVWSTDNGDVMVSDRLILNINIVYFLIYY